MERLDFIASLTKGANSVVDVGCDHAYTLIKAISDYGVNSGVGIDVANKPLECAKENIKKANLEDKISLYLSDGFSAIEPKCDTLVISGMGGENIVDILSYDIDYTKSFTKMIFSPHSNTPKLRFFLINNLFKIEEEYMISDNSKIYEILVVTNKPLEQKYDFYDMNFGPILRKEKPQIFVDKYTKLLEKTKEALLLAKDKQSISKLKMEKAMYEEILK